MRSLRPELLTRYAQIARVLARHAGQDVVDAAGLTDALGPGGPRDDQPEDEERGAALARDLEELGPTWIKLGQLLATRADLLPTAHIEALGQLQDAVAPVPYDGIREVIETELGARVSNLFDVFDEEPLASASLGQVHRAVLRDGREVAVKVQRPDIQAVIERDLEVMRTVAEMLDEHTELGERYRLCDIVEEFRRSLGRELDYRREAVGLRELRDNLAGFDRLTVPDPIDDLVTGRVLVMEHVDGVKVSSMSGVRRLDVDGPALLDELFRAYLKQMLADGFVHADPHPGNVMLTADDELALIDVGMVIRIDRTTRERLLRLLLAVADGDPREAAEVALAMGERTEHHDERAFRRDVSALIGTYHDLPTAETDVGRILIEMTRISGKDGVRPPVELTLLARTLMALEQVASHLDPEYDVDEAIRRHASEVMTETMVDELTPSSVLSTLLESKELVESMPHRVNAITRALAEGSMRLQVDAVDEDRLHAVIRHVANRVTAGLILAALIVGAAMLMRVETQSTIFGYPAVALIFFVVASLMGLWLVLTILRDRD